MPKMKLGTGDKETILIRIKAGESKASLATEYGVSIRYIYLLLEESQEKELSDLLGEDTELEEVEAKGKSIGRNNCVFGNVYDNEIHSYERYEGEEDKYLCSQECYDAYKKVKFPEDSTHGCYNKSFQANVLRRASYYFSDDIE